MPDTLDSKPAIASVNEAFVSGLYKHILRREPQKAEFHHWLSKLDGGMSSAELFHRFTSAPEYMAWHRAKLGHPPGHFYSPIVDPSEPRDYWESSSKTTLSELAGIDIDVADMRRFWIGNQKVVDTAPFTVERSDTARYFYSGGHYPNGDALVLFAMINTHRPRRIIEIGSGFSSAVMLDSADALGLSDLALTFIDPYADRLRSLLRPADASRTTVIERPVQTVPLDLFKTLEADDILFIDSSHVLKAGSDVHYELFSILPTLKPGVIIHIHDIQFPFEYPEDWVFNKGWAWNEIYAVRALLMYSTRFKIQFWTNLFLQTHHDLVAKSLPGHHFINGGSLWLKSLGGR
jgi:predicted O-methyltransferase YrrM